MSELPEGVAEMMQAYIDAAACEGREPDRFIMAADWVPHFATGGGRPVRFSGVKIEPHDAWSWGWMLYVKTTPQEEAEMGSVFDRPKVGPSSRPFEPEEGYL